MLGLLDKLKTPVIEQIIAYLDVEDLLNMRLTCHTGDLYVTDLLRRAYTIKRILCPFFDSDEICEFRELQANTGLVISGSAALQFFNREVYDTDTNKTDLDTYCFLSQAVTVANWLMSKDFRFRPRNDQLYTFRDDWNRVRKPSTNSVVLHSDDYPTRMFTAIWDFVRNDRVVQVIAVRGSIMGAVLGFHSTCVMNVITDRAAYCLFPKLTLIEHTSYAYNNRLTHTRSLPLQQKWINRGFSISHCPTPKHLVSISSGVSIRRFRWVGDDACLKVNFVKQPSNGLPHIIESNSWYMRYRKDGPSIESLLFQPDTKHAGVVVAHRERRAIFKMFQTLVPAIEQKLLSVEDAIARTQSALSWRTVPEWEGNPIVGKMLKSIMRSTYYLPPSDSSSPLVAAVLLENLHTFLEDVYFTHNDVTLHQSGLLRRGSIDNVISFILKVDPSHPKYDTMCSFNDRLISFACRGIDIRFVWLLAPRSSDQITQPSAAN
ncbi:hypothetical protein C8R42DRAFT_720496 [Lentinula raphanica]|nr:hypothetical protein C8R42DRAFT_720496 [Lentinula raphanica]